MLQNILAAPENSPQQCRALQPLLRYTQSIIPTRHSEVRNQTLMAISGCDRHYQISTSSNNLRQFISKALRSDETLQTCDRHRLAEQYCAWARRIYRYKELDFYRRQKPHQNILSLDQSYRNGWSPLIYTVADANPNPLENLLHQEHHQQLRQLVTYLHHDPDNRLKQCHPRRYPHCNAQTILGDRFLRETPLTWQDISTKYDITYGTVTAFYHRRVLKLIAAIALEKFPNLAA